MADLSKYLDPWYRDDDESILEIYDLETGTSETVREFDTVIEAPNWSPDGRALYYNSNGRIFRIDLETRDVCEIDSGFVNACNNDHVISSDGTQLAVSHQTLEDGQSRIYTLPIGGGTPRLITPLAPSYLHGWSPDMSTLAYCACRNGEYDIYTIPAQGGTETRLTTAPGLNDGPEYDSAGEYIWFNSVRTGLMQAWRMRADGSEQTQMTFTSMWSFGSWMPTAETSARWSGSSAVRAPSMSIPGHPTAAGLPMYATASAGSANSETWVRTDEHACKIQRLCPDQYRGP